LRPKLSFTAVGDYLANRRVPENYAGFREVSDFICRGDARFCNLEATFPDDECFGNQFYGGAYVKSDPHVLSDIKRYGFNMLSFANNHTMDFSYRGLLRTLQILRDDGFVNAGVGQNLDEAAAAAYLDTPNGSIGVIGVVSTMMNVAAIAGRQSRRVPGRPGVNGLRVDEHIEVTPEQFDFLQNIIDTSHVNSFLDISRAEGFTPPLPEGTTSIQNMRIERGTDTKYVTHPNKVDMERIIKSIKDARTHCDYVLVSMHSHESKGGIKENQGDFFQEFAHYCIDAGASAVIGHGPHIIRGIEVYKGCPIFYSLGNFIFQEELADYAAEDQYEKYGLTSDTPMYEMYDIRTKNHTRGLLCDHRVLEAFIPYVEIENDKVTKIELMPISLGFEKEYWQMGLPEPGPDLNILERLKKLSEPFGTKIVIRSDGIGVVIL